MPSPINYFGGKHYLSDKIIELMPAHKHYCEVCGGAGHVLFKKEPVYNEIFNDKDDLIVNLFEVLRDRKEEFLENIANYPYSRSLFGRMKGNIPEDPLKKALWYFYMNRTSFNGAGEVFTTSKVKSRASAYRYACGLIDTFSKRLSGVILECLDFEDCIQRYDHPKMLMYIDPPYVGNENAYRMKIVAKDHLRLYNLLKTVKSRVILSYAKTALVESMYRGWNKVEIPQKNSSSLQRGGNRSERIELLFTNF